MNDKHFNRILTINSGSSSVKLALYHVGLAERLILSGKIDRIGLAGSHFEMKDAGGKVVHTTIHESKIGVKWGDTFLGMCTLMNPLA